MRKAIEQLLMHPFALEPNLSRKANLMSSLASNDGAAPPGGAARLEPNLIWPAYVVILVQNYSCLSSCDVDAASRTLALADLRALSSPGCPVSPGRPTRAYDPNIN